MVRTRHGCAREPLELNSRFHNTPATRVLNDAPLLQHFLVAAGKFRLRCPQAFRPSSGVVSTTRLTATRRSSGTESGARHVRKAPQGGFVLNRWYPVATAQGLPGRSIFGCLRSTAIGHCLELQVFLLQRLLHLEVCLSLALHPLLFVVSNDTGMHRLDMH
jgi:hypothetical protein